MHSPIIQTAHRVKYLHKNFESSLCVFGKHVSEMFPLTQCEQCAPEVTLVSLKFFMHGLQSDTSQVQKTLIESCRFLDHLSAQKVDRKHISVCHYHLCSSETSQQSKAIPTNVSGVYKKPSVEMSVPDTASRTINSILVSVNVVSNTLVILVIIRSRSMKTPLNYLLLNLAVADLTAGVFLAPSLILRGTFTYPQGPGGDALCRLFNGSLAWSGLYSSVFSLVFIAFNRYYAVMKPFSIHHRITIKKLKIFIPVCWITSVIITFPLLYFRKFDNRKRVCHLLTKKAYAFFYFPVVGILPVGIMSVLYSRVIHRLWFKKSTNPTTLQVVRLSRKKVTKTMLLISAIYVICWFPDLIAHFLESIFHIQSTWYDVLHSLILLNSTVNPVIYAFQCGKFRRELRKIFCRRGINKRIHVAQRSRRNVNDQRVQ